MRLSGFRGFSGLGLRAWNLAGDLVLGVGRQGQRGGDVRGDVDAHGLRASAPSYRGDSIMSSRGFRGVLTLTLHRHVREPKKKQENPEILRELDGQEAQEERGELQELWRVLILQGLHDQTVSRGEPLRVQRTQ